MNDFLYGVDAVLNALKSKRRVMKRLLFYDATGKYHENIIKSSFDGDKRSQCLKIAQEDAIKIDFVSKRQLEQITEMPHQVILIFIKGDCTEMRFSSYSTH